MTKIPNQNHNLETTLKIAMENFQCKSPVEMAWKSRCSFNTESKSFLVPFMGREFTVVHPSGEIHFVNSPDDVPIIWKILMLHYLARASGNPLTGNNISYKDLSGGDIYFEPFKKRTILPLIKIFGKNPHKLIEAGKRLGGIESDKGDYSVTINIFPCIPITYVLWKGDDEFPPNATVLFDETANEYLHTEDFAFAASFTVYEMAKML
ncbi:DUF3786 domain-containing protein [Desulfitibacter alkalitolerans]|uniref:DUF3786 domain-containing protein n=1 Tax=Desulfitibacter alkalitolerans TaxID=264641 RepID=UPI00068478D9|nr:DUF3786 domain-containing protein [Desulfitibacter alkalitolerans]